MLCYNENQLKNLFEWRFTMNRMLHNKKTIMLFLLPSLIIFIGTVIIPIIWSGYYSLFNWNGIGKM